MTHLTKQPPAPAERVVIRIMGVASLDYFAAAVKACERVAKGRRCDLYMRNITDGFEFFEREVRR